MIGKMILTVLLGCVLLPNGVFAANANVVYNNSHQTTNQSAVSTRNMQDGFDLNSSVSTQAAANEDLEVGANMVNYNLFTKKTNYESFDISNYEKRKESSLRANSINFENKNESKKDIIEQDKPDRIIIGNDDLKRIENTKVDPYIKTGFLEAVYENVYNNETGHRVDVAFYGTAFLVGPNVALTAGHCVYNDITKNDSRFEDNEDNPRFPDYIKIYFGANDRKDFHDLYEYISECIAVSIEYSYFLKTNYDHDWAAVELCTYMGDKLGWYDMDVNVNDNVHEFVTYGYPLNKGVATMWETKGKLTVANKFQYTTNIDSLGGQSGSPYISTFTNAGYVCGIHTCEYKDDQYNGGIIINDLIYNYVMSFIKQDSNPPKYDYLSLSVVNKNGNRWLINVVNTSSMCVKVEYNTKMCYKSDAQNWSGLNNLSSVILKPYSLGEVHMVCVDENWWATSITFSYVYNGTRIITYADNLKYNTNTGGSLTEYHTIKGE